MNTKRAAPFMEVNKKHRSRTMPGTPPNPPGQQEEGPAEVGKAMAPPRRWAVGGGGGKQKKSNMKHPPLFLPFSSGQRGTAWKDGKGENLGVTLLRKPTDGH